MSTAKRHALMADAARMLDREAFFRNRGDVASADRCAAKAAAIYVELAAARK